MLDALQTASGGMVAAVRRLDATARVVADAGTPPGSAALPPAAQVDLSAAALDLVGEKAAFGLNAAVVRVADRMTDRLLDITV